MNYISTAQDRAKLLFRITPFGTSLSESHTSLCVGGSAKSASTSSKTVRQ